MLTGFVCGLDFFCFDFSGFGFDSLASFCTNGYVYSTLINNIVEEEDGECIRFLGGNSSSGIKKYRGLNSSDGGNIGDRVKIAGGVIGSGDEI
ncbi:hypothetical protein Tco_0329962, partial [Tanacetum coccineum]